MAKIDHDAKTVSTVCQTDDEAGVRVALQEILDDNPGYGVILTVEDPMGNEITHTSLSAPVEDEVVEEPAEETEESAEEEAEEDTSDEESTEEEATEEEA